MVPFLDQKVCLNLEKKRSIVCCCTHEQKINFKGFVQNGCYRNEPQPFEVVFYSTDANTSFSFTKQGLTVKQAYRVSFCFVLCSEPKFWKLTLVSRAFLGNNFILYDTHWTNHPCHGLLHYDSILGLHCHAIKNSSKTI